MFLYWVENEYYERDIHKNKPLLRKTPRESKTPVDVAEDESDAEIGTRFDFTKSETPSEREKGLFILDGINNTGFSGGPAVFQLGENRNADFQVFGVVSAYREDKVKVTRKGEETDFTSMANTGLMYCPSIMRAVDMIEANPIGFNLG